MYPSIYEQSTVTRKYPLQVESSCDHSMTKAGTRWADPPGIRTPVCPSVEGKLVRSGADAKAAPAGGR